MPGRTPPQRPDAVRQPDLFGGRGPAAAGRRSEQPAPPASPAPSSLSDDELVGRLADAASSEIDALCAEVVTRSPAAAVPALEALWRRFHGFGIDWPLREQQAVLDTLARLDGEAARVALKGIVLSPGLPALLLRPALRAAADAGLVLPASFVAGFLGNNDAAVREAAFVLARGVNMPADALREGLSDDAAAVRLAAAIALAHRGDASGRDVLIAALANAPSSALVEALGVIGGDEAIVALGRCAERHPGFASDIVAILRDLDNPRADRIAGRLEAGLNDPADDGT